MRFSEAWLREWVDPPVGTAELADQLSMAGLEVDAVEPAAPVFDGVVVGAVTAREQHPDADKLSVCTVDVGADDPLQIVCGAANVAAGMRVPVATVGATLPGDFKIRKAKLRGVQSLGMICSASELGLAETSEGILGLPDDAPVGADIRDYLRLDDACIDVDLTPDRADCLSVAGLAREVGVINRTPVGLPPGGDVAPVTDDRFPVEIVAAEACPRYLCRVVRDIDPTATTPGWMVEKLRRSGVRAISPVVDITNYVMLELGQPMHGFDLATLQGGIRVRMASDGEGLALLDGSEITLRPDSLVIADHDRPVALAGIMGGQPTAVTDRTRDVLLESAFFSPLAVAGRARAYGLHTDSSHRFERGVDFDLQRAAIERATGLLLDIVGGRPGPVVEAVDEARLPEVPTVALRRERIRRVLGVEIADHDVGEILERLGMQVEPTDAGWRVTPPTVRFDIAIEVDLVEEIGRIHGFANIPARLGSAPVSVALRPEGAFDLAQARQLLVHRGYQEAITYSFVSPEMAEMITPGETGIRLANPISTEMSVMRPSIWPGLLQALQYNLARQQGRARLFESGLAFARADDGGIVQHPKLAGLVFGDAAAKQWGLAARRLDFFDAKADVESLLASVCAPGEVQFVPAEHPALHPGQSARVRRGDDDLGWVGLLHPVAQKALDLPQGVCLFELDLVPLRQGRVPAFEPLSKFPAIRRDLAIAVADDVPYQAVLDCIRAAAPAIVRDIQLFDVYTGENIDSGLKSLALSLILQESSHTLTDAEVEQASTVVLDALSRDLKARLRE